ncbi:hypothetical protein IE53DRAFT_65969 [Violaceomyces palustris]|uniref:Uncharacterized protein n=1 Tax=Violaceomyces palustris TaxID=1673888 RepID=A0ACD0NZ11_9BASI|nr:hypothetical protein IE53DRAFT_65969 [Violaceomyces palustris]
MIVRALDMLLERCRSATSRGIGLDLSQVGSIGLCGTLDTPIFLTSSSALSLARLDSSLNLSSQLGFPGFFSLPFIPNSDEGISLTLPLPTPSLLEDMDAEIGERLKVLQRKKGNDYLELSGFGNNIFKVLSGRIPFPLEGERERHFSDCDLDARKQCITLDGIWARTARITTVGGLLFCLPFQ